MLRSFPKSRWTQFVRRREPDQLATREPWYRLLAKKRNREAIEMFKMNVEDHPKSANVYDSLGEAYAAKGDRDAALANYRRSLKMDPTNTNAAAWIAKLEKEAQ